jgi:hypothetical protein
LPGAPWGNGGYSIFKVTILSHLKKNAMSVLGWPAAPEILVPGAMVGSRCHLAGGHPEQMEAASGSGAY